MRTHCLCCGRRFRYEHWETLPIPGWNCGEEWLCRPCYWWSERILEDL